jgi:hypothetical protein
MLSQRLGQPGRERALIVLSLSYGRMGRVLCLRLRSSSGAVGPTGAYPGNRNSGRSGFEWYGCCVGDVVVGTPAGCPLHELASVCNPSCVHVWLVWVFV